MIKYLWRRNPLTLLLWATLVLPGMVAVAFIGWSYNQTLDEARRGAEDDATIVREHALRVFEAQIAAISLIDARITGMDWNQIRDSEAVHKLLKSVADESPHINGVWLVDSDGTGSNSADFFPMPSIDATNRDYFQTLRDEDVTHLGEMIRGKLKGNLNFNISQRRTSADGTFDGLILVTSDLGYFETFWQKIKADTSQIVLILRNDGRILARYPGTDEALPRIPNDSEFYRLAATRSSGMFKGHSITDDKDRLFVVEPLHGFPAFIGVGVDRTALLADWRQRSLGLALLAGALTIFLAWVVYMAVRAEDRLTDEIERRRGAEANLIAKEEHVAALEAADAQLRESQARFRALFETSTQGNVHLANNGTILDVNPAACRLLEVERPAVIGKKMSDLQLDAIGEDGMPVPPAERPAGIVQRTGKIVRDVVLGLRSRHTGEVRWLQIDAIPQRRPGEPRPWSAFLLVNDISEQRRSAQAERILAAEVDHRAKNMLALVQAIVRLSKSDSPDQFVEAVEGRISALSRAHGLLSGSKWGDVDLRSVIEEAVAPYRRAENRDSISVSGPALTLKPETAQPVSLLMHELTTNAVKYGALSAPAGQVAVSWSVDRDAGTLNIVWTETGGPPTVPPERTSFGTRLIQLSVRNDLSGDIDKEWRTEGMCATICIPTKHLGDPAERAGPAIPAGGNLSRTVIDYAGTRILVVEDNALIAAEMADHLDMLGCTVVGPAGSLDEAVRLVTTEAVDVAILDVDLRGQRVYPVADLALSMGIPITFCTGFSTLSELSQRWPGADIVQKPVSHDDIERALARLLAAVNA
jgi:PAS domain S-box-containing protein